MPGFPDYRLRAHRVGAGFHAAVEENGPERNVAVEFFFARDKATFESMKPRLMTWSDTLWSEQSGTGHPRILILRKFEETSAPLCVVCFTTMMALVHHVAMGWLGDYERCLCWGFVEIERGSA